MGLQDKLYLGNIEAKRDWGHAKDYVEAMWKILQQKTPDDYVISTGESHSVKEFITEVFSYLDLDWNEYVEIDPYYFRPTEVLSLLGDSSKAKERLKWEPKIKFNELVRIMTEHDLELAEREAHAMKFNKRQQVTI